MDLESLVFLLSFFKLKKIEEKCVNVSLASFSSNEDSSENKKVINETEIELDNENIIVSRIKGINSEVESIKSDDKQNQQSVSDCFMELSKDELQNIEISILHQLIYKHSVKDLPNSRLPRITGFSTQESKNLFKEIISFFIFFSFIIIAIFSPSNFGIIKPFAVIYFKMFFFLCGLICCVEPFSKFCIWLIRKIKNTSLKRVSFKNAEVELDSYKSDSILNQRLDEILYFFEQTKYEYVVFEDLDRFNSNQIFIHLREINKILNENNKINRSIKFIYAVKDQMFKNEERVKFFDFIIPIIPIINSSSAASELINQSKEHPSYFKKIGLNYFIEIGTFINDMRLLKNILNEYYIYHDRLSKNSENNQKLFSLIVYKNLYPIDFSYMQRQKGCLQEVFDKKRKYIKNMDEDTNALINEHKENIERIKKEKLKSIFELRIIFITEYMHKLGYSVTSNQIYNLCQNGFDNLIKGGGFVVNERYNARSMSFDPNYFNNLRINELTYQERADIITNGIEKEIDKENYIINKAKKDQTKLLNSTVVDLCKMQSEFLEEFELTSVQKYFLKRGFIDENYRDYISIFHEGVLTVSEYEYVMQVRNGEKTEYNLHLSNVKQVIEKIKDIFSDCTPALLNYDILNYLLINKQKFNQELGFLINYITEEEELKFLIGYINECNSKEFLSYAIINNIDFWNEIEKQNISTESTNFISYNILKSLIDTDFSISKINENFIDYINEHSEILQQLNKTDDIEAFFKVIEKMKITFKTIHEELLQTEYIKRNILEKCCFIINYQNLFSISKYLDQDKNGIYSKIICSKYENLKNYITSNIAFVINELFLKSNNIDEDEVEFIDLINTINEPVEVKQKLLLRLNGKITFIKDVEDKELYSSLFKNNKVSVTWNNILTYYTFKEKQLDDIIVSFILDEQNLHELEHESLMNEELKNSYISFLTELYQDERINENVIEKLEDKNKYLLHDFNLKNISSSKLKILIDYKSLKFSNENLEVIRNIDNDFASTFILNNLEEYIKSSEEVILSKSELTNLLYSKDLDDKTKINVFEKNIDNACTYEPKITLLRLIKKGNLYEKLSKTNVLNLENLKAFEFGTLNKDIIPLKIELLLKTNALLTDDEILEILPLFDPDFTKIKTQHSVSIDNPKHQFEELCEMLATRRIIVSVKNNKDKLVLRIK